MKNRLSKEKSPYLLQHQNNPVDWFAWGPEAFEKASREDKPIFLSIGYSTCHWCHVMEHESFEDEKVAEALNDAFINIKVDREERPDIDHIYMSVCQMMTGSGGWPLTIIMTPDQRPFFSGTYFPKESRFGRIGIFDLITRVKQAWSTQRTSILETCNQITNALVPTNANGEKSVNEAVGKNALGLESLNESLKLMKRSFSPVWGGFNDAPKFPTSHNLMFLLRMWKRDADNEALQMVEKTLASMREGGMFDQIGFGFHRYSVDRQWLVPHFEKMLYDQAMLATAYLECFQATGKLNYAQTAREIFEYVLRDLTDRDGGFYSAEDADSEGVEGKFYVWSWQELEAILEPDDLKTIKENFNLKPNGNFTDMGQPSPDNIFYLSQGAFYNINTNPQIDKIRKVLFSKREKRIRPHLDDKILTDWNGLMIAALAKGARVLDDPALLTAAKKAFSFLESKMMTREGKLFHRYRAGDAAIRGILDDYSFMTWAAIELYQSSFESHYLKTALQLSRTIKDLFWDKDNGGLFFTPHDGENLLVRKKEIYDGAVPSGNSVSFWNFMRLARLTGETHFEEIAQSILKAFSNDVNQHLPAHNMFLLGLDFALGPTQETVLVAKKSESESILKRLHQEFLPRNTILLKYTDCDNGISSLAPFTRLMTAPDDRPAVYVCNDFACSRHEVPSP
jgi:uncharacterized protein YyaL (SSP411 family)